MSSKDDNIEILLNALSKDVSKIKQDLQTVRDEKGGRQDESILQRVTNTETKVDSLYEKIDGLVDMMRPIVLRSKTVSNSEPKANAAYAGKSMYRRREFWVWVLLAILFPFVGMYIYYEDMRLPMEKKYYYRDAWMQRYDPEGYIEAMQEYLSNHENLDAETDSLQLLIDAERDSLIEMKTREPEFIKSSD